MALVAAGALLCCAAALAASGGASAYSTTFVNVAQSAGIENLAGIGDPLNPPPPPPLTPNVTWPQYVALMDMWGGAAVGDYNNDGLPDLYLTNGDGGPSALYRNDGNMTFTEVGAAAGVAKDGRSMGAAWGDFDNDGCRDLFVASFTGPSSLFRNNCDGTFTNVTAAANISLNARVAGVAWGDFDRDGRLDLVVGCYIACQNFLFHNRGDGTFEDVSSRIVEVAPGTGLPSAGWTFQPVFIDYDRDGDLDLWDVNDFGQDHLFRNNDDGTFTDVTQALGVDREGAGGMGMAVGDIDNDGLFDFLVTNYYNDSLYRNTGNGFVETFGGSPVNDFLVGWGADFFDAENGGSLDLYLANGFIFEQTHPRFQDDKFFENMGGGVFRNDSAALGAVYGGVSHGVASADFDLDGDPDLFVFNVSGPSMLLRNDGVKGAWLKVNLTGTASNRDAVGAVVTVVAGGISATRMVQAGGSYLSQDDHVLHFGLGGASSVDSITIDWPSGARQVIANGSVNVTLDIREPPLLIASAGGDPRGRPGVAVDLNASGTTDPQDGAFPAGANFTWTVDLGGTVEVLYGEAVNTTFAASGAYKGTLRVEDALGNVDFDPFVVYVRDEKAPNARAGADQAVCDSGLLRLDGGNSTDNDPTFALFGNYTWSVPTPSGVVTLYGVRPSLRLEVPGDYTVTLTARDPSGNAGSDALAVTVQDCTAPAVELPATVDLTEGDLLVLTPQVSDSSPDFATAGAYAWTFENGTGVTSANTKTLTYRFLVPGVFRADLRVADGAGNVGNATAVIVVADVTPPRLHLPDSFGADEGRLLTLDATGATDNDPSFPATGTFTWVVHLRGAGGAEAPLLLYGATPSFSFGTPGTFRADLTVSDRAGNTQNATTRVVISDRTPPLVRAGLNQEVTAGSTVVFEATATDNDPAFASDPGSSSYTWSFTYAGRRVPLAGPRAEFRFEVPGVYIVTLTVRDAAGNEATDHLDVRVVQAAADPWPATERVLAAVALGALALTAVPFWRRGRAKGLEDEAAEK